MDGKQVRLFLVDGTVGGLMTAEILNWTGHMLRGRRKDLGLIKKRAEAGRTGVYILFGTGTDGQITAYIGESDNVATRLDQHNVLKEFWEDVVIITSKDMNLTKAHVRYLEAELVKLAKIIGRVALTNASDPTGGAALPEADQSDMHYFIRQIRTLMPVLGFDVFRGRSVQHTTAGTTQETVQNADTTTSDEDLEAADSPIFFLTTRNGVNARAQIIDGEFTVLENSVINGEMKVRPNSSASTQKQFISRGAEHTKVLGISIPGPSPGLVTLTKDYVFTSPSAAASIVNGRASANGRLEWKTTEGQTYAAWEQGRGNTD